MPGRVKIFFDGGWRPATGMETAVVVRGQEYVRRRLGPGSAMEAEWLALLHAVELAAQLGVCAPLFLGDSLAVVGQATGIAKCPDDHVRYLRALAALRPGRGDVRIRHIKRSQNLAGIALARLHER